jgi:hypothetical protein
MFEVSVPDATVLDGLLSAQQYRDSLA